MRFIYKFLQLVLGAFFALLTLGALGLFALYSHYAPQLPDEAELRKIDVQVPLRIYTRDGELLAEYGERRSRPVILEEVPERLKQAFLDIEDARFLSASRGRCQRRIAGVGQCGVNRFSQSGC